MPGKPNLNLGPVDTIRAFKASADAELVKAFHELLENKHLYQNSTVDPKVLLKERVAPRTDTQTLQGVERQCYQWFAREWTLGHFAPQAAPPVGNLTDPSPHVILRSIQVVCTGCRAKQAHMPVEWVDDTAVALSRRMVVRTKPTVTVQVWTVSFQCQVCHGQPAVFLIRRDGVRLRLDGRSPLEVLDLPKFIPAAEADLYRDGVIAFNAGKHLAGLFYLRCTIEQFARRVAGITDRHTGDELMDAYAATLPSDLRDRMPSFRHLYERLSDALHAVRGDEALFCDALAQINKHFEIRRVFEVPDKAPAPGHEERVDDTTRDV